MITTKGFLVINRDFKIQRRDGNENVAWKVNSLSQLFLPTYMYFVKCRRTFLELNS